MNSPDRISARALGVAAVVLTLSGCLTRALWNWTDPDAIPELDVTATVCDLDAVLVEDGAPPTSAATYAVAFTPRASQRAPRHLIERSRQGPVWLVVRGRGEFPVAESMDDFRPRSYEVDVFDGVHLRRRTNNVRLALYGNVAPHAVGAIVDASDVPAALRSLARMDDGPIAPWGPAREALRALGSQSWAELVAPDGPPPAQGTPQPLAFVDAEGAVIPPEEVQDALTAPADDPRVARLAAASLLARIDEGRRTTYLRVRLPVLLNADRLGLQRDGATLAFVWAQRGVGRFVRAAAVPAGFEPLALARHDQSLVYEWTTELPVVSPWKPPIQILLTPLTWILDFVIESNPSLRALRDALFPPPEPPMRPRRTR